MTTHSHDERLNKIHVNLDTDVFCVKGYYLYHFTSGHCAKCDIPVFWVVFRTSGFGAVSVVGITPTTTLRSDDTGNDNNLN